MSSLNRSSVSEPEVAAVRPPNQLELLQRIDARLEHIEARLSKLDPLIDGAPGLLALAGDSFDEFARELGDLDERVRAAARLAERVTRPQTLVQLHAALDLLESLPGVVAMAGDAFDEFANDAAARGVPLDQIVPELRRAFEAMLQLLTSTQLTQLLGSSLLPGTIDALGTAARAMAAAAQAPETKLGLFGTLKALREPEVQRAVGFAVDFARRFGTNVDQLQLPPGTSLETKAQTP
jgi:uncharacterized protein YjgD (DUF1641 family)